MTHSSSVDISLKDKKKSFFSKAMLHNGIQNVKSNLRLIIVIFILHLAAVPMALAALMGEISINRSDDVEAYLVIGFISTGIAVAAGMVCVLSIFDYLYKKTEVDKRYSLPMTTLQRFVSDFLSGLFIYIVPFIASQIISAVMLLAGHIIFDGKPYLERNPEIMCSLFENITPYWWRLALGGLMIMLMFYALCVIITSCCGSLFECIGYTLLVNFFVPAIGFMLSISISNRVEGLQDTDLITHLISCFSPIGGVVGLILSLEELNIMSQPSAVPVIVDFGRWFAGFTAMTLIMCPLGYLFYRKRRAEDTGKPVIFRWVYHFIMFLTISGIIIMFMLQEDDEFIIPCIIVTSVIYMVFSVITNRGFSHFFRSCVSYVITALAGIMLFFGAGLAAEIPAAYVPDPSEIKKAYISYNGYFENDSTEFGTYYCSEAVTEITDKSQLEIITEAHRIQLDQHSSVYNSDDHYQVLYQLNSGKLVLRNYYCFSEEATLKLSQLDMTDNFRQRRAELNSKSFAEAWTYTKEAVELGHNDYEAYTLTVRPAFYIPGLYIQDRLSESISYYSLPEDFAEKIGKCIYNDIMNETEEEYFRYKGNTYYVYFNFATFLLKDCHTETINYLKACGIKSFNTYSENDTAAILNNDCDIRFGSDKFNEFATGKELVCSSRINSYRYSTPLDYIFPFDCAQLGNNFSEPSKKEIQDMHVIMNAAKPTYKTDESCYTITAGGSNAAVIPYEYSEIAERLYIKAVIDTFASDRMNVTEYYEEYDPNYGMYNTTIRFSYFLKAFLECYGEECIKDAYAYYTDEETAQSAYDAMKYFVDDTADKRDGSFVYR